jgi:hypothetical protein
VTSVTLRFKVIRIVPLQEEAKGSCVHVFHIDVVVGTPLSAVSIIVIMRAILLVCTGRTPRGSPLIPGLGGREIGAGGLTILWLASR